MVPERETPGAQGSTEVLGSDQTIEINALVASGKQPATLRVLLPTGDVFDREIPGSEVQLGKGPRNDIVITDPAVSTAHAAIKLDGSTYTVSDLGSRNGTYLNGERITEPKELRHGDVIGMGLSKITFRMGGHSETGAIGIAQLGLAKAEAAPAPTEQALADAVVAEHLASETDVARLRSNANGKRFAPSLVDEHVIGEVALCDLIARTFHIP